MSRRLLPLLAVLALLAAACGGSASGSASDAADATDAAAPGGDGPVTAVASSYPLAWVAEQVAPDAEITDLSESGTDPHDFQLSPSQREAMETSDVVLYMGDIDFMPQVEQAVDSAQGAVVSAAEVAGDRVLRGAEHAHEEEGEEHAEEGSEHADEGSEHADEGGEVVDPHMWFDPSIMADVATATGAAFAQADPDNAATYEQNAADLTEQMTALQTELDDLLGGDCTFDEVIVSHEAFNYLLEPYGKTEHGVTGVDAEAGAASGELAELVEEIESEGFQHVVTDVLEGREDAEALAREAGVELLEANSLDVVDPEQAEVGYPDLLRQQAETFATALGCS